MTTPTRARRAPHHLPSRAAITLAAAITLGPALLAAGCAATPRDTIPPPTPTAAATSIATAAPDAPPTLAQRFPDTAATPPARDPQRAARLAAALTAVETKLRERVEAGDMVGLAAGVVVDGELTWSKGFGTRVTGAAAPIDADTVFRAGSITKTLTGAALLRLRDDGKLTFDEPIARLVPELAAVIYPTRDSPPITVRHLVTHTAGLVRHGPLASIIKPGATPTDADLTGLLKDMKLEAPPGAKREYSNLGGALAGLVVTRAARMPCRDYLSKTFLTPLGMTSSGWDLDPAAKDRTATGHQKKGKDWVASKDPEILGAVESAGGLYTTVRDLSRYAVFQTSAWPPRDEPETAPVRRSSLRESHQPAGLQPVDRDQKGVFWSLEAHCKMGHLVLHNGGMAEGFRSSLLFLPQAGLSIVLLSNGLDRAAPKDLDELAEEALESLAEHDAKSIPGVEDALQTARSLIAKPDPDVLKKNFTDAWFEKPGDLDDLVRFFTKLGASTGACGAHRWLRSKGPRGAVAELTCDKRKLEVSVAVAQQDPKRISGLHVISRTPCP